MTTNYTMEQLSSFLYDALNEEDLSAHQIYESIIDTVAEHTEYLQLQYQKSQKLFDLLKSTAKPYEAPWTKFIDDNKDGFLSEERESNFPKEDIVKSWILPVDDDGVITLPEDLLKRSGWKEGDVLVYEVCNGNVLVRKKESLSDDEMVAAGYTMTDDGFWIYEANENA